MAVQHRPLKYIVRHFTPAWFAVTMGTGAVSLLFLNFPFGTGSLPLRICTLAFFFLNLALFTLFFLISLARYLLFPDIWQIMLRHPIQSLYTGTFPMGATTLINVAIKLINHEYNIGGRPFAYAIWAVWWLDVVISVICCWGMVHVMETQHTGKHSLDKMTATWLLPVVTLIVASSSGGVIAPIIQQYSASHALVTVVTSIVMVTIGLSLALMILTVYLLRLITYGLPPCATIISVFLPLGPTGQAGYSILLIGQFFNSILPYSSSSSSSHILTDPLTGKIINVICLCTSFVLWSLASMWVLFAILGVQDVVRVQRSKIPFRVPFWGLIFPNGVYANLTISLGQTLDSQFFRVFGAIYACFTIAAWVFVATRTVLMVRTREIFEAPCLEDIDIGGHGSVPRSSRIGGVSHCQSTTAPLTDKE